MSAAMAFSNPFRPGAGHQPPYLAGREVERGEFTKLLGQSVILQNLVLTGLRGVGKTVLLETFKPVAIANGWLWAGTDLSESASINEEHLAMRLLTDVSVVSSSLFHVIEKEPSLFNQERVREQRRLDHNVLFDLYDQTPGLVADKLKNVLEFVNENLPERTKGIIFAYDEAQNLVDHAAKEQYPLSILLEVFQSLQKRGVRMMLALTGLPTLFPNLVEARTYSERMFRVLFLERLTEDESRDAVRKPIDDAACPVKFSNESVQLICQVSAGYPYFIQFICREVYDIFIQQTQDGERRSVPINDITRKLDSDFFAGRWARATDRQRELLWIIAQLPSASDEFSVQEIVERSRQGGVKPFSSSHVNQMLGTLSEAGLIYKNRHGRYSFAVPLLEQFIRRQRKPGS